MFLTSPGPSYFAEDKEKLPTALHSLGNHLWPCPCGCRTAAISTHRLQSRGISTILVRQSTTPLQARHIRPRELAMNVGICMPPEDLRHLTPLRHCLAQLGQCAWIFGHLAQTLHLYASPLQAMKERTVASWLHHISPNADAPTTTVQLSSWEDPDYASPALCLVNHPQRLTHLLPAEHRLQGFPPLEEEPQDDRALTPVRILDSRHPIGRFIGPLRSSSSHL